MFAGVRLGNAELALGRLAEARQAFEQARARGLEIASALQHDAGAGLARVALAQGNTADALAALQPLLDHLAAGGMMEGTEYPRWIELTALMTQADAISRQSTDPALRHGFLNNIPHHRQIVAAWEAAQVQARVSDSSGNAAAHATDSATASTTSPPVPQAHAG